LTRGGIGSVGICGRAESDACVLPTRQPSEEIAGAAPFGRAAALLMANCKEASCVTVVVSGRRRRVRVRMPHDVSSDGGSPVLSGGGSTGRESVPRRWFPWRCRGLRYPGDIRLPIAGWVLPLGAAEA